MSDQLREAAGRAPDILALVEVGRRVEEARFEAIHLPNDYSISAGLGLERLTQTVEAAKVLANPATILSLLDERDALAGERDSALELLLTRYVTPDLVHLVGHAMKDLSNQAETICRLRGGTDADADLKRFVHMVDHAPDISRGAISEIIDFAQGQVNRRDDAESRAREAEAEHIAEANSLRERALERTVAAQAAEAQVEELRRERDEARRWAKAEADQNDEVKQWRDQYLRQLEAAQATIKALRAGLSEADGCFEAALVEGWNEALADEDIHRIRDLYCRRIGYARDAVQRALLQPTERGDG